MKIYDASTFPLSRVWLQLWQELAAPCLLPAQRMLDLLWGTGNLLGFKRLHIAAHETGSHRSSCTCTLDIPWGPGSIVRLAIFLESTQILQQKQTWLPLSTDRKAMCGSRMQPVPLFSPFKTRLDHATWPSSLLVKHRIPPTHAPTEHVVSPNIILCSIL